MQTPAIVGRISPDTAGNVGFSNWKDSAKHVSDKRPEVIPEVTQAINGPQFNFLGQTTFIFSRFCSCRLPGKNQIRHLKVGKYLKCIKHICKVYMLTILVIQ